MSMSAEPISDAIARCAICGEPMPAGEEMFKFHGYSGPCPKPPLPKPAPPEDPREARIRALEAEIARKDAALRQIAEPRNWYEQERARQIARAALGPWVPTHQHEDGHTLRLVMRLTSGDVVCDHRGGDSFVIEPEGFEQWYRPLTPDEARAAVEGRS